ncbi:MAG TPA: ribonuclease P protein component [Candidatus Binatia bacterium]|nr:ribonuclease P protein component [Candidatus Binatia bacterium]
MDARDCGTSVWAGRGQRRSQGSAPSPHSADRLRHHVHGFTPVMRLRSPVPGSSEAGPGPRMQPGSPRLEALRGHGRFAAVLDQRCRARCGAVRVDAARRADGGLRVGLSTPGMRRAVERNRLRRRLREALRCLGPADGYDLVVSSDAGALGLPFAELSRQVAEAAGRAMEMAARPPAGEPPRPASGRAQNEAHRPPETAARPSGGAMS